MRVLPSSVTCFSVWMCVLQVLVGIASADVVQLSRIEVIQESELIFSGEVLTKTYRWNDRGNLILTDYEFRVDQVFKGEYAGETILLTFAGGELDGEFHAVSDVPTFEVNQVVLLMLESIHRPIFSPITGAYQGKFYLDLIQAPENAIVLDGNDQPVTDANGATMGLIRFQSMIVAEIAQAAKLPMRDKTVPEHLQQYVLKDLPSVPYDGKATGGFGDAIRPEIAPDTQLPIQPGKKRNMDGSDLNREKPLGGSDVNLQWSYSHRAKNVPIVFNPWPESFPTWLYHQDQFSMAFWNNYCDIYRVMTATGTWAWENGRYDMAGFESNQTMIDQFGEGWGANTLAVCWKRWDGTGFSIEADIAFNPAFSWTTTPFAAYSNGNLHYLPQSITHEVGHAWGLDHQFNVLSTMNYSPHKYRSYDLLYMDDALAIRAAFSGNAVPRTDLGVYLYYSNGYQNWSDSTLSQSVVQTGSNLTVSNVVIENVGTTSISPTIDWYLTPTVGSWSTYYYIGSTTHSNLNSGEWFLTSRTLTMPSGIPNGSYHLAAFITNATDSLARNNSSWHGPTIVMNNPTPPANDNWEGGISIASTFPSTQTGTNVAATTQPNEQHVNPAMATVWWYVRAPADGIFTIDTVGSNFDTILHIYTGYENGFANLQLVTANDDAVGLQSRVVFPAVANQYYEIRVAGYLGASGNIVLNLAFEEAASEISNAAVFYSGSSFDTSDIWQSVDYSKVVVKQTSSPQTLGYQNLINAGSGLTGLRFWVDNLPASSLAPSDFVFQVSPMGAFNPSSNPPINWQTATAPSSIQVIPDGGSSRIDLIWPNNTIVNRWLRITIKANANTGLQADEVYYIGHLLGSVVGDSSSGVFTISFADIAGIRGQIGQMVDAASPHDINKDGTVTFADISSMRGNVGAQLPAVTVP